MVPSGLQKLARGAEKKIRVSCRWSLRYKREKVSAGNHDSSDSYGPRIDLWYLNHFIRLKTNHQLLLHVHNAHSAGVHVGIQASRIMGSQLVGAIQLVACAVLELPTIAAV